MWKEAGGSGTARPYGRGGFSFVSGEPTRMKPCIVEKVCWCLREKSITGVTLDQGDAGGSRDASGASVVEPVELALAASRAAGDLRRELENDGIT